MSVESTNTLKLLAICGIAAPILVIVLSSVAGSLRPSFDPVAQFGSELGVGNDTAAVIANASFILYGLLIVAFAAGLYMGIGKDGNSVIGPVFMGVYGLASVLAGIVHCDPGCPLLNQAPSLSQAVHDTLFIVIELAIILAPLAIWIQIRGNGLWQKYRTYSLVTGAGTLVLFVIFELGVQLSNYLSPWRGTVELVTVIPMMVWTEVMAVRLLRLPVHPSESRLAPRSRLATSNLT